MNNRKILIEKHFAELAIIYPDLNLEHTSGISVVRGPVDFRVPHEGTYAQDSFFLEIFIPSDYNKTPPNVKEIGGRIPRNFHTSHDGFLCLEVPIEVRKRFSEDPSLLGFVNSLLIPYLFSFCYWKKYGVMPHGEHPHGCKGIFEYYRGVFNVNSGDNVLNLLKILLTKNYRAHHDCPCGSGRKFSQCHKEILLKLDKCQSQTDFSKDFLDCEEYLRKSGKQYSDRYLIKNCLAK